MKISNLRRWLVRVASWIACAGAAWTGVAFASPNSNSPLHPTPYEIAEQLCKEGDYDEALPIIEDELGKTPKSLPLLWLHGEVLQRLRDYPGALAAFEAYLRSDAKGAKLHQARQIVKLLSPARSTFLEITLENGPAEIYVDSRSQGVFCTAAPSCLKGMLPIKYTIIAERPGFETWIDDLTIMNGKTTKLAITLVEKPSLLKVRTSAPNAHVTIDGTPHHILIDQQASGTPYYAATPVAAGPHQIAVSLAGHVTKQLEVTAHEGRPIEVAVVLTPVTPVRISPSHAELVLDDKLVVLDAGALEIPLGTHVLVARAQGFYDRRIEIPAERAAGYKLDIELEPERVAPPAAPRSPAVSAVPEPLSPPARTTVARPPRAR